MTPYDLRTNAIWAIASADFAIYDHMVDRVVKTAQFHIDKGCPEPTAIQKGIDKHLSWTETFRERCI